MSLVYISGSSEIQAMIENAPRLDEETLRQLLADARCGSSVSAASNQMQQLQLHDASGMQWAKSAVVRPTPFLAKCCK